MLRIRTEEHLLLPDTLLARIPAGIVWECLKRSVSESLVMRSFVNQ